LKNPQKISPEQQKAGHKANKIFFQKFSKEKIKTTTFRGI